ncbi:glycosyltransferase family 39 protein [Candidatus Desantisbacteria bacterium]|nr:glycosyltransferase family 39 protein [Candidatus Desantisbacteria bacterium]
MAIINDLRLFEITWLLIICLASYALGKTIIKRLLARLELTSRLEDVLFCLALGFGCLSLITLFIGIIGGLYPWVFWILLSGIIILYLRKLFVVTASLIRVEDKFMRLLKLNLPAKAEFILLIAGILFPLLILVLVPTMTYDAMVYHLAVPAKYIQAHCIHYIPYICFSNYSMNMEMLFTMGLLLGNDTLAKFIHLMFGLLSGAGIFCLAKRHFGQETAWFSLAIFFSIPLACFIMVQPFNDLGLVFYEIMAVYAFINWTTTGKKPWLVMCALMCGFAIGVKYTGGICIIILMAGVVWEGIRSHHGFMSMSINLSLLLLIPLILNLPWFIRSFVYTGNPVYPMLYPLFNSINWNEFNQMRYIHEMTVGYGPQVALYLKPFVCIYQLCLDWKGKGVAICPVFLLLLPGIIFIRKTPRVFKLLSAYCLLFFLIWLYTSPVDRFLLPCMGILSIITGYIASSFLLQNKFLRFLSITAIILCCLWNSYHLCRTIWVNSYWKCIHKAAEQQLLKEQSVIADYYSTVTYINNNLPIDSKILFIGETRSYYCQHKVLCNSHLDTTIIVEIIKKSRDEYDVCKRLKQQGITHILYNQTGADWLSQKFDYFHWDNRSQAEIYQRFMTGHLIPVYQKKEIMLFRIENNFELCN